MEDTRIYYFSAKWCGPCKTFKPVMEKLEEKGYPIYFVDIDEDPILAESHQIRSVPTIKIEEDEKVLETIIGLREPAELLSKFQLYAPLEEDEDESGS